MAGVEQIAALTSFSNRKEVINYHQVVADIVEEMGEAHRLFAPHYDSIAYYFDKGNAVDTCKALFSFLKKNVRYDIEPEENQTTKSPGAILHFSEGDCKHYAGFTAGVLDALNRQGAGIPWVYRFASYNLWKPEPGHVFVVAWDENGNEIWIDPVLKYFNQRLEPMYMVDKLPKSVKMLSRVSGIDQERQAGEALHAAIKTLYHFGVMDADGNIDDAKIDRLSTTLPASQFNALAHARIVIGQAMAGESIGFLGFLADLIPVVSDLFSGGDDGPPEPTPEQYEQQAQSIARQAYAANPWAGSGGFSAACYLQRYPDLQRWPKTLAEHYVKYGNAEDRIPGCTPDANTSLAMTFGVAKQQLYTPGGNYQPSQGGTVSPPNTQFANPWLLAALAGGALYFFTRKKGKA